MIYLHQNILGSLKANYPVNMENYFLLIVVGMYACICVKYLKNHLLHSGFKVSYPVKPEDDFVHFKCLCVCD